MKSVFWLKSLFYTTQRWNLDIKSSFICCEFNFEIDWTIVTQTSVAVLFWSFWPNHSVVIKMQMFEPFHDSEAPLQLLIDVWQLTNPNYWWCVKLLKAPQQENLVYLIHLFFCRLRNWDISDQITWKYLKEPIPSELTDWKIKQLVAN